jgi:NTE family protein
LFDFLVGRGKGDASAELGGLREAVPQARPAIGLALGGGAARGFAHIGVLRTLIAHGLTPDVIAGTSIGALAGALYATGHLDKFEEWSRALSRRSVFGYLDFSFSGSGLIRGNRLADRLAEEVGEALIEELPLRFAAIATEVGTGHEIWLTRGKLVEALRGSYALPGIFMPVLIGRRWLMDGALVNPVPVSAARALGARVVIAVNLNADLFGRGTTIATPDDTADWLPPVKNGVEGAAERLVKRQMLGTANRPGISTVMMEAFNIMQDRITRARLAGEPPDVMVSPRLARISPFDFHRATEAIEIGAEAAEKAIEQIQEAIAALT